MSITILGMHQDKLQQIIETSNQKLDMTDLYLLSYIRGAIGSPRMYRKEQDGLLYVWLQHKKIREDLFVLDISESALKRRLLKLVKAGLLSSIQVHNTAIAGSMTYYALTNLFYDVVNGAQLKNELSSNGAQLKNELSNNIVNKKDNIIKRDKVGKPTVSHSSKSFLDSVKGKTKKSLYQQASDLICCFTNDKKIQKALFEFLDLQLEIYKQKDKVFYINTFKNRLNKLKTEFDEKDWLEVIQYAVGGGYQGFYPVPDNAKQKSKNRPSFQPYETRNVLESEEKKRAREEATERRIRNGQKAVF